MNLSNSPARVSKPTAIDSFGETRTYSQLAAATGNPQAVRAAGTACGANPVSIVIPCHRAQRIDGSMGGYAYGIDRKRTLRDREGVE